jgi:hypothetical protein
MSGWSFFLYSSFILQKSYIGSGCVDLCLIILFNILCHYSLVTSSPVLVLYCLLKHIPFVAYRPVSDMWSFFFCEGSDMWSLSIMHSQIRNLPCYKLFNKSALHNNNLVP